LIIDLLGLYLNDTYPKNYGDLDVLKLNGGLLNFNKYNLTIKAHNENSEPVKVSVILNMDLRQNEAN